MLKKIEAYLPKNEQEEMDRALMLDFLRRHDDAYLRTNRLAHMTASAWVTDRTRSRVLMVYHNIYDSWSWCGGHADGERDLLQVALRECREETGLEAVRPVTEDIFSLECLTVDGHEKRGAYVSSHLHLNVTYLLEGDPASPVRCRPEENSRVGWFALADAPAVSSEPWMRERIYRKLNAKLSAFPPMNLQ